MTELETMRSALRELLEQIDLLDDVTLCRDIEPYKAQACWDDALSRARKALTYQQPRPFVDDPDMARDSV